MTHVIIGDQRYTRFDETCQTQYILSKYNDSRTVSKAFFGPNLNWVIGVIGKISEIQLAGVPVTNHTPVNLDIYVQRFRQKDYERVAKLSLVLNEIREVRLRVFVTSKEKRLDSWFKDQKHKSAVDSTFEVDEQPYTIYSRTTLSAVDASVDHSVLAPLQGIGARQLTLLAPEATIPFDPENPKYESDFVVLGFAKPDFRYFDTYVDGVCIMAQLTATVVVEGYDVPASMCAVRVHNVAVGDASRVVEKTACVVLPGSEFDCAQQIGTCFVGDRVLDNFRGRVRDGQSVLAAVLSATGDVVEGVISKSTVIAEEPVDARFAQNAINDNPSPEQFAVLTQNAATAHVRMESRGEGRKYEEAEGAAFNTLKHKAQTAATQIALMSIADILIVGFWIRAKTRVQRAIFAAMFFMRILQWWRFFTTNYMGVVDVIDQCFYLFRAFIYYCFYPPTPDHEQQADEDNIERDPNDPNADRTAAACVDCHRAAHAATGASSLSAFGRVRAAIRGYFAHGFVEASRNDLDTNLDQIDRGYPVTSQAVRGPNVEIAARRLRTKKFDDAKASRERNVQNHIEDLQQRSNKIVSILTGPGEPGVKLQESKNPRREFHAKHQEWMSNRRGELGELQNKYAIWQDENGLAINEQFESSIKTQLEVLGQADDAYYDLISPVANLTLDLENQICCQGDGVASSSRQIPTDGVTPAGGPHAVGASSSSATSS